MRQTAYTDSPYLIKVSALDRNYDPVEIYAADLELIVTQPGSIKRVIYQIEGSQFT